MFGWVDSQLLCWDPWWWQKQSSNSFGLCNYRHIKMCNILITMQRNLNLLDTILYVHICVCVLTELQSWWTSWAAALSCWAIHTWAPRTWPTAAPRYSAGGGLRVPPCDRYQEHGWGCSTPAPAACGRREESEWNKDILEKCTRIILLYT